jgi:hypothetical protein
MLRSLFFDLFIGLLLLVSLSVFYLSTQVFNGTVFFYRYDWLDFIRGSLRNPINLLMHVIAFSVLIFLSSSSVYIHKKIADMTTISDVLLICITPAIVLFFYGLSTPGRDLEILVLTLLSNTILLIIGGLIGWFFYH